jgi:hypothetical protein
VAERLIEGQATPEELKAAWGEREAAFMTALCRRPWPTWRPRPGARSATVAIADFTVKGNADETGAWHCALLRDIFTNPSCSAPAVDPAWLLWHGGAIPQLAQAVYMERRFSELPLLADMLTDAGCTGADILEHCRSGRDHVRGCWVVDFLTGRE